MTAQALESSKMTRRNFVAGAALAGAAAMGAARAIADEAAGSDDADSPEDAGDAEAAGVPEWLGAAPEISDEECAETVDTEILVVGAGNSGLFAAVTAAEEGAKVMLIDRMELGFGIRCSGLGAVDSQMQKDQGVIIDKMEIINDVVHYADNKCDMRLWRMWANESGEAIDWYCDHVNESGAAHVELEWNMPEGTRYHMWPTGHGTLGNDNVWAGEHAMLQYFIDYLNSFEGCEHRGYTKLDKLIVEDGKVVGAYCSDRRGLRDPHPRKRVQGRRRRHGRLRAEH